MKNKVKFVIGGKVSVINDTLIGHVIDVKTNSITIECEDGFNYTFHPGELIHISNLSIELPEDMDFEPDPLEINTENSNASKLVQRVQEIDLHIHELIDSERGLQNYDKLKIQLGAAQEALEEAISKRERKIVFIHGKGTGILKKNLLQLLKKYPVEYQDASYLKYGNGATEVRIYQNKK